MNNSRRLFEFFHENFDAATCAAKYQNEDDSIIVTDQLGQSLKFVIKFDHVYCLDLKKCYAG